MSSTASTIAPASRPAIYTTDQVAELLRLHIKTVRLLIARGELEASLVGRKYLVTGDQLQRYLDRRAVA